MENEDSFIGFTARKKDNSDITKQNSTTNKFSSPGVEHKDALGFSTFFLWAGIPIALIGFISFIVFVLGVASTFWSYMKIKSEAEIGNEIAKNRRSGSKPALIIVGLLVPIRLFTLAMLGI